MNKNKNTNLDSRIEKMRKLAVSLDLIGLVGILLVVILDLSYPNILFSVGLSLSIALVFVSLWLFIFIWMMDIHLVHKRRQIWLLLILILGAAAFVFWTLFK